MKKREIDFPLRKVITVGSTTGRANDTVITEYSATLECGHTIKIGKTTFMYRKRLGRLKCYKCPPVRLQP